GRARTARRLRDLVQRARGRLPAHVPGDHPRREGRRARTGAGAVGTTGPDLGAVREIRKLPRGLGDRRRDRTDDPGEPAPPGAPARRRGPGGGPGRVARRRPARLSGGTRPPRARRAAAPVPSHGRPDPRTAAPGPSHRAGAPGSRRTATAADQPGDPRRIPASWVAWATSR